MSLLLPVILAFLFLLLLLLTAAAVIALQALQFLAASLCLLSFV